MGMVTDLVIIIVLVLVLVGLPFYMWKRHGWNLISEAASAILEFVRSIMS